MLLSYPDVFVVVSKPKGRVPVPNDEDEEESGGLALPACELWWMNPGDQSGSVCMDLLEPRLDHGTFHDNTNTGWMTTGTATIVDTDAIFGGRGFSLLNAARNSYRTHRSEFDNFGNK